MRPLLLLALVSACGGSVFTEREAEPIEAAPPTPHRDAGATVVDARPAEDAMPDAAMPDAAALDVAVVEEPDASPPPDTSVPPPPDTGAPDTFVSPPPDTGAPDTSQLDGACKPVSAACTSIFYDPSVCPNAPDGGLFNACTATAPPCGCGYSAAGSTMLGAVVYCCPAGE